MIYEQRTYTTHPGKLPAFLDLYQRQGLELQLRVIGNLVGYFVTEIGPLNQLVHIWGFDSFEERLRRRAALWEKPEWVAFADAAQPLLARTESKIMLPTAFSPLQ